MTSQNKQIIKINHEAMTLTTTKCNLIQQFNEILTQDLPSIRRSLRATDKLLLLVALPSSLQHFTAKIKRHLLPRSVNYMSTQSAGGPGNREGQSSFFHLCRTQLMKLEKCVFLCSNINRVISVPKGYVVLHVFSEMTLTKQFFETVKKCGS